MNSLLLYLSFLFGVFNCSVGLQCSVANNNFRLDCFPQFGSNEAACLARGCCWSSPKKINSRFKTDWSTDVPYCYYPVDYDNYQVVSVKPTPRGQKALLKRLVKSYLPDEISTLLLEVIYETRSRVRVRITDPTSDRYEVPIELGPADAVLPNDPEYEVIIPNNGSFSLEIKRKVDGVSMFKSYGPLLYSNQFIQLSTLMSTDQVYGIGEQNRPLLHNLTAGWSRLGLWARDNAIDTNINLYGTHPVYIAMPSDGTAFGTYFFNSNAQEFGFQPAPLITYRTIGGILDMFFFTGGNPETAVSQYLELIGKPMLPPYWSLGFHLCKYGYKSVDEISAIFHRNIAAGIPIGTQWADIDYMDKYKDFTVDATNFKGLSAFIKMIRQNNGARFVVIIDPGIYDKGGSTYSPYTDGIDMNVYIKDPRTLKPLEGMVWPGNTVYPDFTHPNITAYWTKQIQRFYSYAAIDGLWIDMNEPSNFVDGSTTGCTKNDKYDNPFFVPSIRDNSLITKTICSSALQYGNVLHYNLHNLYGYKESVTTNNALRSIKPNQRIFLLSRSTFSGSGKYTNHWTGDNYASWDQMAHSIRQIISFNMFGIAMTGADICGFINNSWEELCIRWMQLGAFYPFMRNHNTLNDRDQDPAAWSVKAQKIMRTSIQTRYALLPYLYTLLAKAHLNGTTVFRPLSFEFYSDPATHSIDLQFMLGSALLVTPVLTQGATSVSGYFPAGVWYDFNNGTIVRSGNTGGIVSLDAPLEKINVALRGGQILILQEPAMTIDGMRQNDFTLYCAMSTNMTATGELYWDDGISMDSFTGNKFSYFAFNADSKGLFTTSRHVFYEVLPTLSGFIFLGIKKPSISKVIVNGNSVGFHFYATNGVLILDKLQVDLATGVTVNWY